MALPTVVIQLFLFSSTIIYSTRFLVPARPTHTESHIMAQSLSKKQAAALARAQEKGYQPRQHIERDAQRGRTEVGTVKYSQTSDPVTFDCQVLANRDT
jgi:hypothetical protein